MEQAAVAPNTISGKRATIVMLVILASTGALFYWVTTAYSSYNAARRQGERLWRELAPELDARYRELDRSIASSQESKQLEPQLAERWHSARQTFSTTALVRAQVGAAQELETLVARMPDEVKGTAAVSDKLAELVEQYNQAAIVQRNIGQQMGSKLLKTMLILPDPIQLDLH